MRLAVITGECNYADVRLHLTANRVYELICDLLLNDSYYFIEFNVY